MEVTIVVGTTEYILNVEVARRSEYIKDLMELDDYDGTIKLTSISNEVFSHVLEFMFDDTYPIPKRYEGRLKFFQINYNPNIWLRCKRCTETRVEGSNYCKDHKCCYRFCGREKGVGDECLRHCCSSNNCEERVCTDYDGRFTFACSDHVCNHGQCVRVKKVDSFYCTHHDENDYPCKICGRSSIIGSQYCVGHKCSQSLCKSMKGPGKNCLEHSSKRSGSRRGRI